MLVEHAATLFIICVHLFITCATTGIGRLIAHLAVEVHEHVSGWFYFHGLICNAVVELFGR